MQKSLLPRFGIDYRKCSPGLWNMAWEAGVDLGHKNAEISAPLQRPLQIGKQIQSIDQFSRTLYSDWWHLAGSASVYLVDISELCSLDKAVAGPKD
jgi:hypothetical protein